MCRPDKGRWPRARAGEGQGRVENKGTTKEQVRNNKGTTKGKQRATCILPRYLLRRSVVEHACGMGHSTWIPELNLTPRAQRPQGSKAATYEDRGLRMEDGRARVRVLPRTRMGLKGTGGERSGAPAPPARPLGRLKMSYGPVKLKYGNSKTAGRGCSRHAGDRCQLWGWSWRHLALPQKLRMSSSSGLTTLWAKSSALAKDIKGSAKLRHLTAVRVSQPLGKIVRGSDWCHLPFASHSRM